VNSLKLKLTLIALAGFFLFMGFTSTQPNEKNRIYWNTTRKLIWEDYKGIPDTNLPMQALTSYHVTYSCSPGKNTLTFIVDAYFSQNDSWVTTGKGTPKLLKHEQLHFDLAELCARKIRKDFSTAKFTRTDLKSQVNAIWNKDFNELNNLQELYDNETDHSKVDSAQAAWEKKVPAAIKELDAYKSNIVRTQLL